MRAPKKSNQRKGPLQRAPTCRDALAAGFQTAGQQTRPGKPGLRHVDPLIRLKPLHSAALQWGKNHAEQIIKTFLNQCFMDIAW